MPAFTRPIKESRRIRQALEALFAGTEYRSRIGEIEALLNGGKGKSPKVIYLDALRRFGRRDGLAVYRQLKSRAEGCRGPRKLGKDGYSMKTAVMTDTNSGISVKEGRELGVFVLPMPVLIGGASYTEGVDISSRQLFTALSQGVEASTSQPSPAAVTELWDGIFARGYEEIVHIPMTSGLSGSCESAMQLAQAYGGRVQVADNRRISLLQKASVLDAKYLADRGLSAAEVRARLEKNGPNAIVYIAVDTLEYLKKSGRVTAAAAAISTVMNIKPVLRIQGGKLEPVAKIRGMQRCQEKMIQLLREQLETRFWRFPREKLLIGTAGSFGSPAEENAWRAQVQKAFPKFKVRYEPLSCSISCHTGQNARGLAVMVLEQPMEGI